MSIKAPTFLVSCEDDQVAIHAEAHREAPEVLFEMLGSTVLRTYNAAVPKEENIYLSVTDDPHTRLANSELIVAETHSRAMHLVSTFDDVCAKLRNVSDRQLEALVDYAKSRLAIDELDEL